MKVEDRAVQYGAGCLSDRELLSAFVGEVKASAILEAAGSLYALRKWTIDDFKGFCTNRRAFKVISMLEAGVRALQEPDCSRRLEGGEDVRRYMAPMCMALEVEKFWVLHVDRRNRLLRREEVSSGTANNTLVHAREVFRSAIKCGASGVICVHNHPSGNPAPSRADILVTRQLNDASKVIGIDLLDHIVVGERAKDPQFLGYYSFTDAGLI